ncbi:hypothetical protein [Streptomyces sp. NPDC003554]
MEVPFVPGGARAVQEVSGLVGVGVVRDRPRPCERDDGIEGVMPRDTQLLALAGDLDEPGDQHNEHEGAGGCRTGVDHATKRENR